MNYKTCLGMCWSNVKHAWMPKITISCNFYKAFYFSIIVLFCRKLRSPFGGGRATSIACRGRVTTVMRGLLGTNSLYHWVIFKNYYWITEINNSLFCNCDWHRKWYWTGRQNAIQWCSGYIWNNILVKLHFKMSYL